MVYAPVYKDIYYTTTASSLNYVITNDSGGVLFSGKAQSMPGQDGLRINVNKVCQDYLSQDGRIITERGNSFTNDGAVKTFHLKNANGNILESYTFLYCYDYDFNWSGETDVDLTLRIVDEIIPGMKKLHTFINENRQVVTELWHTNKTVCGDYGLYFVNRQGGWESFAIQGTGVKSDNIQQYTTDKSFDNNTMEFEANRYLSEIKTSYVLNTHYMSDDQAFLLAKHLFSSNFVYLHNLKEGYITPVIITDTSVTYQTYQTNGKKMAQYKIAVTESQSKIRR